MIFKIHTISNFVIILIITSVNVFNLNNIGEVNNFILDLLKIYYIVSIKND